MATWHSLEKCHVPLNKISVLFLVFPSGDGFRTAVYTYVFPVFYAFGLIGCICNLTILSPKKFYPRTFTYLRAIAFSDICFISLHIPLAKFAASKWENSLEEVADDKSLMTYHIFVEEPLINAVWSTSGLIILCMTIDRYFAISKPIQYTNNRKYLNAKMDVLLCWITGLLLYLPEVFCTKEMIEQKCIITDSGYCHCPESPTETIDLMRAGNRTCFYYEKIFAYEDTKITDTNLWRAYKIIREVMIRFGPTLLLILLNVAIIINFNKSIRRRKKLRASHFFQRSSSQLFENRPSKFFVPPRTRKLSSAT